MQERQRSPRTKPWLSSLPHGRHNGAASLLTVLIYKSANFFASIYGHVRDGFRNYSRILIQFL